MKILLTAGLTALCLLPATAVRAQGTSPGLIVESGGGFASFVDDAPIHHGVIQGSARFFVSPRVAIGPEITYMIGPGADRDLMITGAVTIDLATRGSSAARVTPYVIAAAGWQRNRSEVGTGLYYSSEGALSGGAGVRIAPTPRWYIAPEFRFGWELHWRTGAVVGVRF